jgi:hypothetical protein
VTTQGDPALQGIMDFPWEVLEYLSWLRQQPSSRDLARSYLFDEPKVRFCVAEHDVIVADPALRVVTQGNELRLVSPRAAAVATCFSRRMPWSPRKRQSQGSK